ncbi:MAG: hypothetical protein ACI8TX_003152 [Hyphomicrobiaceae bacterium]|jgi:hypothetical protein
MNSSPLVLRAGARAAAVLTDRGLQPDAFSTLVGASGGPKWLALARMDAVLARRFLAPRTTPLAMVGSSIGSFRHACLAQIDPQAALARFEESYLEQVYETAPSPELVTAESVRILKAVLADDGIGEVLANPLLHTHIIAVRSRTLMRGRRRWTTAAGLAAAATSNAVSRGLLGQFFERIVFHSGEQPVLEFGGIPTTTVSLTPRNMIDALAASGSVPLVMAPIIDPHDAPRGMYRDGGIVDYHFDFAFRRPPGLVLYPHFFDRITPGWFDKALAWRRPSRQALADTVLLAPSPAFIAKLPGGHVPDRKDFQSMANHERLKQWKQVLAATEALADDLESLMDGPIDPSRILEFP